MSESPELAFSVSDFVAVLNQSMDYAFPSVTIVGELANFRISKNRWVYFDLKDELSSVKFFGTVYQLSGPLEDGLMLQVRGAPRLHNQFGFSLTVQSLSPVGEGSIKKAAALLEAKLAAEGLFDPARKRSLPYPPKRIGLIASGESAAYKDFMKILNARFSGVEVLHADVQVQGEPAPRQIVRAIDYFNTHAEPVDVLVVTRGGGSAEDLAAFSTEQVTRAVAGSRIPTLVAIGHEVDISLAELAADQRASTPSNAAELLVPDKTYEIEKLTLQRQQLADSLKQGLKDSKQQLVDKATELSRLLEQLLKLTRQNLHTQLQLLEALSPQAALQRGYAVLRTGNGTVVRSVQQVKPYDQATVQLANGSLEVTVNKVQ